jgi:6-phosphogluconate dehydrogenase
MSAVVDVHLGGGKVCVCVCVYTWPPQEERVAAAKFYEGLGVKAPEPLAGVDKAQLISDVRDALYASKICSYAQVRRPLLCPHLTK